MVLKTACTVRINYLLKLQTANLMDMSSNAFTALCLASRCDSPGVICGLQMNGIELIKLNKFMLDMFMRTRDIIVDIWPYVGLSVRHLLSELETSDRILVGTLVEFCDVINIFLILGVFSLMF